MCGIFGYAKTQNGQSDNQLEKLKDVFTYLADESVVRGTDSTGISMINPTNRRTFKATASSSEVVNDKTWKSEILDRVDRDSTIAIGHVRLATHGVINTRNAHPFEIGDVIGAHNGIIYNYNKLADKYNKNMLLFFYRPDCEYCEKMKNESLADPSVISLINENFFPVMINGKSKDPITYNDITYVNNKPTPAPTKNN